MCCALKNACANYLRNRSLLEIFPSILSSWLTWLLYLYFCNGYSFSHFCQLRNLATIIWQSSQPYIKRRCKNVDSTDLLFASGETPVSWFLNKLQSIAMTTMCESNNAWVLVVLAATCALTSVSQRDERLLSWFPCTLTMWYKDSFTTLSA